MISTDTPAEQGFPGGFSVLMAVCGKDDPALFGQALASVFGNNLMPDQVVLVVDGPVPEVLDARITAAERDPAVETVRLAANKGVATALNAGLAHIRAAWIVRADADDYNLPRRFSRLAAFLRLRPETDIVGSAILELGRDGTPTAVREMPLRHDDILLFMKRRNPFNHMTVACRRTLVEQCGGYPDINGREDYALWARMMNAGARCANLPEVLVHAAAGENMYRRRSGMRYALAERHLQKLLVDLGLKSQLRGLTDGIMRAGVFLAPACLRRFIYEKALRQRPGAHL